MVALKTEASKEMAVVQTAVLNCETFTDRFRPQLPFFTSSALESYQVCGASPHPHIVNLNSRNGTSRSSITRQMAHLCACACASAAHKFIFIGSIGWHKFSLKANCKHKAPKQKGKKHEEVPGGTRKKV